MVNDLMSDLEKFVHDEEIKMPALVKAALLHVHPSVPGWQWPSWPFADHVVAVYRWHVD